MLDPQWRVPDQLDAPSPPSTPASGTEPPLATHDQTTPPGVRSGRADSDIMVEEIQDDDLGYASEIEVIYPDELEEIESSSSSNDDDEAEDKHVYKHEHEPEQADPSNDSDTAMSQPVHGLRCHEHLASSAPAHHHHHHHQRDRNDNAPRTAPSARKRTHSESTAFDSDGLDSVPTDGGKSSTRRMRRRVNGPPGKQPTSVLGHADDASTLQRTAVGQAVGCSAVLEGDAMDLDPSQTVAVSAD